MIELKLSAVDNRSVEIDKAGSDAVPAQCYKVDICDRRRYKVWYVRCWTFHDSKVIV